MWTRNRATPGTPPEIEPGVRGYKPGFPPTGPLPPRISRGARRADGTNKTRPLVWGMFVCVCVCVSLSLDLPLSLCLSLSLSLSLRVCECLSVCMFVCECVCVCVRVGGMGGWMEAML